jgi:hypothetical protein
MARLLAISLGLIVFAAAAPSSAQRIIFLDPNGPPTSDPGHIGYALDQNDLPFPMKWQDMETGCEPCLPFETAYNKTMQSLLSTRYWIAEIEDRAEEIQVSDSKNYVRHTPLDASQPLNEQQERETNEKIAYRLDLENLVGRLPALHAQEDSLKTLSDDLLTQLNHCAIKTCRSTTIEEKSAVITEAENILPFEWKGPYNNTCEPCIKEAEYLNRSPATAREITANLEAALAELMFAEVELLSIQAEHTALGLRAVEAYKQENKGASPPENYIEELRKDYDKRSGKRISELEEKRQRAEEDIAANETALDKITADFGNILDAYNICMGSCKELMGPPVPASRGGQTTY